MEHSAIPGAVRAEPVEVRRIEKLAFNYGDERICFVVRRQPERKLNRIAIHVEPDRRVVVDAPSSASSDRVLSAVKKRSSRICQPVAVLHARLAQVLPRDYVSGESVYYLGRR